MVQESQLRELLETMLRLPSNSLNAATSLASLDNSLGEAKLRLGLKRLGVRLSPGVRPASFGDLCNILYPEPAPVVNLPAPLGVQPPLESAFAGLRVGLDIQDIASLPVATDYWDEVFYSSTFGKSEIAYAVMQPEPRIHFAGFWCAKEALRKCDPAFATVEPAATMVAHETSGNPYLVWKSPAGDARVEYLARRRDRRGCGGAKSPDVQAA